MRPAGIADHPTLAIDHGAAVGHAHGPEPGQGQDMLSRLADLARRRFVDPEGNEARRRPRLDDREVLAVGAVADREGPALAAPTDGCAELVARRRAHRDPDGRLREHLVPGVVDGTRPAVAV